MTQDEETTNLAANLEKSYNSIKNDLNIKPNFSDLNKYFNLDEIDDNVRILKKIRSKITEVLEDYSKLLEELLSPDNNMKDIIESKELSEEERNQAFKQYKKLRYYIRWSNLCELRNLDKEDAEFIDKCFSEFPEMQQNIIKLVEKLKNCWNKEMLPDEKAEYFG